MNVPKQRSPVSAVWVDETQSLYFVNLASSGQERSIFRYSYQDGLLYSAYVEGIDWIRFILPAQQKCCKSTDLFAVASGSQAFTIRWDGFSPRATFVSNLFSLDANIPKSGAAAARTDPRGRYFGGTLFDGYCSNSNNDILSVYRYDRKKGLTQLFSGLKITSGFAFNEKARKMYHLGSCKLKIVEFDYDPDTGDICNFLFFYLFCRSFFSQTLNFHDQHRDFIANFVVNSRQWTCCIRF